MVGVAFICCKFVAKIKCHVTYCRLLAIVHTRRGYALKMRQIFSA